MDNSRNAFSDLLDRTIVFFQNNGWYVVILFFVLYYLKPHWEEKQAAMSLAHANLSSRREILDRESRRVRRQQEESFFATASPAVKAKKRSK